MSDIRSRNWRFRICKPKSLTFQTLPSFTFKIYLFLCQTYGTEIEDSGSASRDLWLSKFCTVVCCSCLSSPAVCPAGLFILCFISMFFMAFRLSIFLSFLESLSSLTANRVLMSLSWPLSLYWKFCFLHHRLPLLRRNYRTRDETTNQPTSLLIKQTIENSIKISADKSGLEP